MLKCLSRTGVKLGGKLSDKKNVLAERLAFWLNQVVEAGREVHREDLDGHELSDPSDGEPCALKDGFFCQTLLRSARCHWTLLLHRSRRRAHWGTHRPRSSRRMLWRSWIKSCVKRKRH